MGFQQALSGLNASSTSLDTIGNNVANSSTVGFKLSHTEFSDAFASSMQGGGTSAVGIGTQVSTVAQQFTQGNLTTTNNPLDIAVNGGGMFRMSNNGLITYTRNGQFQLDKSGYIVNAAGLKLTGYPADATTGAIVPGYITPLQMNNNAIPPLATSLAQVQVNVDSRSTTPTSMTSGTSTGSAAPVFASPLVAGTGDSFDIAVDGMAPVAVTLPAGLYPGPGQIATAMQTAINTALGATGAAVTVSLNASGQLVVTSNSVGTTGTQGLGSSVVLSPNGANTGYANLFMGGLAVPPTATTGVDNFSTTNTNSYTASTAETVYDSLGNPHTLSMYYVKTSQPTKWQFYTALDGGAPSPVTNLTFSSTGVLTVPSAGTMLPQTFTISTGATSPLSFNLDLAGTTQYGIPFGTNQLTQDGYTSGKLSGMSISTDGVVQGNYSNGKARNMGQLVLANFNNQNGLQSLGNNQWGETAASGSPIPGAPGTGSLGLVQSGAVEESNVDLTSALVDMITAQRNYQANAQTIKTMDQVMQTLINLR